MSKPSKWCPRQPDPKNRTRRVIIHLLTTACIALGFHERVLGQGKDPLPKLDELPVTGIKDSNFAKFDEAMTAFIKERKLPGASFAITKDGRLVYARGFGYSDVEKKESIHPASLLRIGSISKPITAVAILQLVERGKLKLDDKAFEILKFEPHLEFGAKLDPRLNKVTILQLLQHTGGWDREKSFDPAARPWDIAKSMKFRPPVRPEHIVRYMIGKPLDFEPGERHAYSNWGYLALGLVVEKLTGQSYEAYVRKEIFTPLGIKRMRLGKGAIEDRAPGEVKYYDSQKRMGLAVEGPRIGEMVPLPYGAENLQGFEAHGGWLGSAVDVVRFASAFDQPARCKILSEKSIQIMFARPDGPAGQEGNGKPKSVFYGCGWEVRPQGDKANHSWHAGVTSASTSIVIRFPDGVNWAVLFNADTKLDLPLDGATEKVKRWPEGDLFEKFL